MKICIIGTGYVGLVSGACFAALGHKVIGVEADSSRLTAIFDFCQAKIDRLPIFEPGLEELVRRNYAANRFAMVFQTPCEELLSAEIFFICTGTPPGEDGHADLSSVLAAARQIAELPRAATGLSPGDPVPEQHRIVVTKSTVPVGTGDRIVGVLKEHGQTGVEYHVASNPEFLKEGTAIDDFMKPDRIVIGTNDDYAEEVLMRLYAPLVRTGAPIYAMSRKSAEITKYAANTMLAMRITFMNVIAGLCDEVGANVDEVRLGIGSDSRIGRAFLFPGVGYGGSCFGKDVSALARTLDEAGFTIGAGLVDCIDELNERQKLYHVEQFLERESGHDPVVVLGLAFKPNTDDTRDAPALAAINVLRDEGIEVRVVDPVAKREPDTGQYVYNDIYAAAGGAQALFLVTEWPEFRNIDWERLKKVMKWSSGMLPAIFDGRNIWDPNEVVAAGFRYYGVGR